MESPVFFGLVGAGSALALSCAGAAFGTAKSANFRKSLNQSAFGTKPVNYNSVSDSVQDFVTNDIRQQPKLLLSLIPVIIAGVLAIYGLIYCVIVLAAVTAEDYSECRGYAQFVGGLTVGVCCLASGLAVGMVGNQGLCSIVHTKASPVKMILNLIYCEALGLYGLIFGLIAASAF